MSSESVSSAATDFSATAQRLGFLSDEDGKRLRAESQRSDAPISRVAVQLGLLDAAQIDTVETLLRPTEAIPGYEILDVRGRGGMGVVYRARQMNLGRIVALKTLLVSRLADEGFLNRFQQEARTLAQLRHPNIVSIYDFGRTDGRVYLAMEFVDGTDVEALIKSDGGLSEQVAWGLARQVAAGLAHGDRQGIVHRDIKPANLLLVDPPEGFPLPAGVPMVKIADFGLAMLADDGDLRTRLTRDNATVGSPHYMAPEQFQASRVDRRADIYSLGATVYHMLAGQPPFAELSLTQIIGVKLSGRPQPLDSLRPGIAPETLALVDRLMARDPDERPQDYAGVLSAIDELGVNASETIPLPAQLGVSTNSATVVGDDVPTRIALPRQQTDPRSTPPARRRRWLLVAGALLAIVSVPIALFLAGRTSPPPIRVPMVETGSSTFLFNGSSIFGWTTIGGEWRVPTGDAVIAGADGQLARNLPQEAANASEWFRLVVVVELHTARSAAVHFGLDAEHAATGAFDARIPHYVVQLTEDSVTLGEQIGGDDVQPLAPPSSMTIGTDQQHALVIERLPTGWFVTVDAMQIGAVPLRSQELPQIRLSASGDTAWFSDIEFAELRPRE